MIIKYMSMNSDLIIQYISQNELSLALSKFIEICDKNSSIHDSLVLLLGRLNSLNKQYFIGNIGFKDHHEAENKIRAGILGLYNTYTIDIGKNGNPTLHGEIEFFRINNYSFKNLLMEVYINNSLSLNLSPNERLSLKLPTGEYSIRSKIRSIFSNTCDLLVIENKKRHLELSFPFFGISPLIKILN